LEKIEREKGKADRIVGDKERGKVEKRLRQTERSIDGKTDRIVGN
jgi:hypothetical protein